MIKKTHILYALFTELITPRYITCAVFNHNIILLFFTFTTIRVSHTTFQKTTTNLQRQN